MNFWKKWFCEHEYKAVMSTEHTDKSIKYIIPGSWQISEAGKYAYEVSYYKYVISFICPKCSKIKVLKEFWGDDSDQLAIHFLNQLNQNHEKK